MSSRRPPAAPRTSSIYTQVRTEDEDVFIPVVRQSKGNSPLLWLAIVVLSLLLAGNAWQQGGLFNAHNSLGSYENGFRTELGPYWSIDEISRSADLITVQSYIRLEKKRFHGAFRVDDQGYWHMSTNPDEPTYVGKPSRDIDNAWVRLKTRQHSSFSSRRMMTEAFSSSILWPHGR
jgi:hypothetical protein